MSDIKNNFSMDTVKEYIANGDSCASLKNKDFTKALLFYEKAKAVAYGLLSNCDRETGEEINKLLGEIYRKIGDLYFNTRIDGIVDYETAINWYKYARLYKDERAILTLSEIYLGVFNIPEYYDREKGMRYLSELADAGNEEAQFYLGNILLSDGSDESLKGAEKCFKKCGSNPGLYRVWLASLKE